MKTFGFVLEVVLLQFFILCTGKIIGLVFSVSFQRMPSEENEIILYFTVVMLYNFFVLMPCIPVYFCLSALFVMEYPSKCHSVTIHILWSVHGVGGGRVGGWRVHWVGDGRVGGWRVYGVGVCVVVWVMVVG